jgi:hypothetical protein
MTVNAENSACGGGILGGGFLCLIEDGLGDAVISASESQVPF